MKLVQPTCLNKNIIIIDGLSRAGKFYLGKLISGIKELEYFTASSEIERLIQSGLTNIISEQDASALIAISVNEEIYNRAIGRNLNSRSDDGSSILNSWEKEKYFARQERKPGWDAVQKILDKNRHSVFLLHQSLMALEIIKNAIPNHRIINIRRHPVDLVFSWIQRGWGHRYSGGDPLNYDLIFQYAYTDSYLPYFAIDWSEEYLQANEYDRVVKSVIYLTEKESNAIDRCEDTICHVYYDHLVNNTKKEIGKICGFLKKQPHDNIAELIKKETRNIDIISSRSDKKTRFTII